MRSTATASFGAALLACFVLTSGAAWAGAPVPPIDTGAFGVQLGARLNVVKAAFAPRGQISGAEWLRSEGPGGVRLIWRCRAADRCFASPAGAEFYFIHDRLAAVDLRFDSERAAPELSTQRALFDMEVKASWGSADAKTAAVGRRVRYFTEPDFTVAWIQDGPDVQLKLYLDVLDPVGRAEAVVAGASAAGLKGLAGGQAYADAHRAIGARDWALAVKTLRPLARKRGTRGLSALLRSEARLVLAMTLGARAKARAGAGDGPGAVADLTEAARLAPQFAAEFTALRTQLGL